ncbi:MAG TPA: hypothetical protein VKB49_23875 [Candidatus Sulfotelmatobacter sp.]|nr:hypothetical protein [Candidatus Sulfotelmatobacter sp.]
MAASMGIPRLYWAVALIVSASCADREVNQCPKKVDDPLVLSFIRRINRDEYKYGGTQQMFHLLPPGVKFLPVGSYIGVTSPGWGALRILRPTRPAVNS